MHEFVESTRGPERIADMAARVEAITRRPTVKHQAWKDVQTHYKKVKDLHLRQLFAEDPKRGESMIAEAVGLFLDYSKNRITGETLRLLIQLAEESQLQERVDAMFRGEKITSRRSVLSCTSPCAHRATLRSSWTARMLCPKCMLYSTKWPILPTECEAAS